MRVVIAVWTCMMLAIDARAQPIFPDARNISEQALRHPVSKPNRAIAAAHRRVLTIQRPRPVTEIKFTCRKLRKRQEIHAEETKYTFK
jgi:hypothetical protein